VNSALAWTKDGKAFFYGRYPEPPAGKTPSKRVKDKKISITRSARAQAARSP